MPIEFEQATADAVALIGDTKSLVRAVFSGRRRNMQPNAEKIELRPVQIKDEIKLQLIEIAGTTSKTSNIAPDSDLIIKHMNSGFANILIESVNQTMSIRFTKKGDAQVFIEASKNQQSLSHDKQKQRMLDAADPFLREVGIADAHGRIKPTKQDKYLQVEEFLRILVPALTSAVAADHIKISDSEPLSIVDHGCGNAYLTFAAHQYLRQIYPLIKVTGIDIREQSRLRNSEIAQRLDISESIEFRAEAIAQTEIENADIMIALHACDTATDDAIAWSVNADVKLALIAPCCHHDIQAQMNEIPEPWSLLTRNGIMKERLGDLLTDALRMQIMKLRGYRVEAIEFVGGEHTPRNLMIRAVKTGAIADAGDEAKYEQMLTLWKVKPALATLLNR